MGEGIKKGEIKESGGRGGGLPDKEGPGVVQKELPGLGVEGRVSDSAAGLNFWVGGRGQGFWDLGPKIRGDLQVVEE